MVQDLWFIAEIHQRTMFQLYESPWLQRRNINLCLWELKQMSTRGHCTFNLILLPEQEWWDKSIHRRSAPINLSALAFKNALIKLFSLGLFLWSLKYDCILWTKLKLLMICFISSILNTRFYHYFLWNKHKIDTLCQKTFSGIEAIFMF